MAYSGESHKASTSVNYDSRVVLTSKLIIYESRDVNYDRRGFIRASFISGTGHN